MRQAEILIIGELIYDLVSAGNIFATIDNFRVHGGGPAGNAAVNLCRQGKSVAVVAAVGDDPPGEFLRADLQRAGVDVSLLQTDPRRRTPLVCVWNVRNEPRYLPLVSHRPELVWSDPVERAVSASRMLVLSSRAIAADDFFSGFQRFWNESEGARPRLVMDLNLIQRTLDDPLTDRLGWLIPRLEYLQVSLVNLQRHYPPLGMAADPLQTATDWLRARGARAAVITRGKEGYRLLTRGIVQDVAVKAVEVVSSSGAGDGFFAGVVCGIMAGQELGLAVRQGEVMARRVLGEPGPRLSGGSDQGQSSSGSGKIPTE